jgi:hypothetical protein
MPDALADVNVNGMLHGGLLVSVSLSSNSCAKSARAAARIRRIAECEFATGFASCEFTGGLNRISQIPAPRSGVFPWRRPR